MCEKLPYCAREIDPCLISQIDMINAMGNGMKTISSCCGHGKYKATIVLLRQRDMMLIEWFTGEIIGKYDKKKPKQYNRIYKKDREGYYFIPFLVQNTTNNQNGNP